MPGGRTGRLSLLCVVTISIIAGKAVDASSSLGDRDAPLRVGDTPVSEVLRRLGAKLEQGAGRRELLNYAGYFDRVDRDGDGRHSKVEYIDNAGYMTPQARRGIFNAADNDKDGFVTKAEYVLNRIITDEAKTIVQRMDDDKNGPVRREEFIKHATARLSDAELARQVFAALDTDGNQEITIPEYLRVWGTWARAGRKSAEDRIAARESELGSSSDGPGGRSNREERRERAERLRSPLEALKDRFEARTFDAGDGKSIPYRLFKPQQRDAKTRVPLVVYLHGAGGRGTDNLKQITGGNLYGSRIWALSENQARHPCYVLAPQLTQGVSGPRKMAARGEKTADAVSDVAPAGKWKQIVDSPIGEMTMELTLRKEGHAWSGQLRVPRRGTITLAKVFYENGRLTYLTSGPISLKGEFAVEGRRFTGTLTTIGNERRAANVMALIRSVVEEFRVDEDRIYITGQSMGGAGTWGMLAFYPDVFAAAVPVCGSGDVASAPAIVAGGTAVWAFHGDADPRVPVEASRRMIAALRAAGAHPRYTEYPGVKHDAWTDAYPEPTLHRWLFERKRQP